MRLYILFIGPPHKDAEWRDEGLLGAFRFIKRVLKLLEVLDTCDEGAQSSPTPIENDIVRKMHLTIKEVTQDLEGNFQFNTAISKIMELVNKLYKALENGSVAKRVLKEVVDCVFLLLAPFTPHVSEEANRALGYAESIFRRTWPVYEEKYLKEEEIEIAVLVNGRVRERMMISAQWSEEEIQEKSLALEKVKTFLEKRPPKKVIYIDKKIVNIVV